MEHSSVATSGVRARAQIFFLAAHAMPLIRWNLSTEALEQEDLPLLQGVTPAGHTCDLGLSAFADDFAKKIVGRSEKELFEALKHSDEVLGKGTRHRCWRTVHVERQQSGGTALPKEGGSHCMAVYGQILDGEGTLGHETHHFGLQGPRSCGCSGGNLRVARLGDAGDQFSAVQLHESNALRTCQDGGKWASSAVAQSASTRALANSTCIGGSGAEEVWMAPGDAAGRDESCSTAGGDFWSVSGQRCAGREWVTV